MSNITTNTLVSSLTRLIKAVNSGQISSTDLADRLNSFYINSLANFGDAAVNNDPYTSAKIAEIANYFQNLQDFIQNGIGSFIVSGLDVRATEPPSNYVLISTGLAYVQGKKVGLNSEQLFAVDLSKADSLYIYLTVAGALGCDARPVGPSVVLARIDKKQSYANQIVDDASDTQNGAFIVSAKDILFENRHEFDDDSIAALKNTLQIIFAENIFGSLRLSENLQITNTQGTLVLDSCQMKLLDPNKNLLARFNANGVFFYSAIGEEYSHFGKCSARVGNIKITPNSLESSNFTSNEVGFQIKSDGNAEFNNVTVRGTIYANLGAIGGWTIGTTKLTGGDAELDSAGILKLGADNNVAILNAQHTTYRFWIGNQDPANAPFSVAKTGALKSTSGTIGGWQITDTALSANNILLSNAGLIQVGEHVTLNGIEESITATKGFLANWQITPTSLKTTDDSIILDSQNKRIDIGSNIRLDGLNQRAESTNFISGFQGWRLDGLGNPEFQNCVVRGRLHTSVFVKDEIHATNGQLLVTNASTLKFAVDDGETRFYIKDDVFSVGNRLKIKDGFSMEIFKVTAIGSNSSGFYVDVTRNFDSQGAYPWPAGTAIVSVESRVQLVASGGTYCPYIDVIDRINDTTENLKTRLGNLNGISGCVGFGLWSENVYLTGKITATSGAIAEWTISGARLKSTDDKIVLDSANNKITLGLYNDIIVLNANDPDYRFWIGNANYNLAQFRVSKTGILYAVGATLQGEIRANSGYIGTVTDGWTITSNSIIATGSGSIQTSSLANTGIKLDSTSLRGYDGTNPRFELRTSGSGYLGDTNTFAWNTGGVLTLAGFRADSSSLTSGSGTNAVGIASFGSYGFYAGNTTPGSAPFRVNFAGNLYANNADITGSVNCTSLTATDRV